MGSFQLAAKQTLTGRATAGSDLLQYLLIIADISGKAAESQKLVPSLFSNHRHFSIFTAQFQACEPLAVSTQFVFESQDVYRVTFRRCTLCVLRCCDWPRTPLYAMKICFRALLSWVNQRILFATES